jgi:hypothetical protein
MQVFIQRGKDRCYSISPVKGEDTLMNKEEFLMKVDNAMKQHAEGNYKILTPEYRNQLFGDQ